MKTDSRKQIMEFIRERVKEEIVVKIAENLLESLWAKKTYTPHSNKLTALTLVYMAYRKAKIPKALEEVAEMYMEYNTNSPIIRKVEIGRQFKKFKKILRMAYCEDVSLISSSCILTTKPEMYIERFGEKLQLTKKSIDYAKELLKEYKGYSISSNPVIVAGTFIYYSSLINKERRTQRKVADTLCMSEVSLRQNFLKLLQIYPSLKVGLEETK